MQKSATVRVRTFKPSDSEFVSSLTTRFSEFELPIWRITNEIDNKNRISLQKAIEEPEPESAIFIAEDDVDGLAGFIHLQTQIDYLAAINTVIFPI